MTALECRHWLDSSCALVSGSSPRNHLPWSLGCPVAVYVANEVWVAAEHRGDDPVVDERAQLFHGDQVATAQIGHLIGEALPVISGQMVEDVVRRCRGGGGSGRIGVHPLSCYLTKCKEGLRQVPGIEPECAAWWRSPIPTG